MALRHWFSCRFGMASPQNSTFRSSGIRHFSRIPELATPIITVGTQKMVLMRFSATNSGSLAGNRKSTSGMMTISAPVLHIV